MTQMNTDKIDKNSEFLVTINQISQQILIYLSVYICVIRA